MEDNSEVEEKLQNLKKNDDYKSQPGTESGNADQRFVNLMVKIIVNAAIRESDEESN